MKKNKSINRQVSEMLYKSNYKINESPRYHQVIENDEEFDIVPNEIYEAGDEKEPVVPQNPTAELPPVDPNQPPVDPNQPPVTDPNQPIAPPQEQLPPVGDNQMPFDPNQPPADLAPVISADDIQNEIIRINLDAMKGIHDQLLTLDDMVKAMNTKIDSLSADVEEVREPSNGEKLMNKGEVSYPYYYNLNDYWSGNWFKDKQDEEYGKGIRKLADGTFIADYDDLPKNFGDISKTFSDY